MAKQVMDQSASSNDSKVRAPYEAPAIIYEGLITTRAISGDLPDGAPTEGITDPVEIFDN